MQAFLRAHEFVGVVFKRTLKLELPSFKLDTHNRDKKVFKTNF